MAIKYIYRTQFDQHLPQRPDLGGLVGIETEWFSNQKANTLGTIGQGIGLMQWGYVVLLQDEVGVFRVTESRTGYESREAARHELLEGMEAAEMRRQQKVLAID